MLRADFDRSLSELLDNLMALGKMVEGAIIKSMAALQARDLKASFEVIHEDSQVNEKRFELEEQCIDLIATQQPLATDLRMLLAVLHIAVELERMRDYAEGIGKIGLMVGDEPQPEPPAELQEMADRGLDMLRRSLKALVQRDMDAASQVWSDDDAVDVLYDEVVKKLLLGMTQTPSGIESGTHLLWVAHDLERIADRATNIAERVIFLVTGKQMPPHWYVG
ncbi:MAG: phosphate transport system regulatory protein PhoU [SAR202 cluster bacterium Io17-Chloro-G9]|nr:MAG: phosphate transport system regulatory protein PhoU [SAR202 cluster bacterium Io17-Chloro-G9]